MRGVTAAVAAAATDERLVLKEKATQIYEKKKCGRNFVAWSEMRFIAFGMLVTRLVELYVHISKQQ